METAQAPEAVRPPDEFVARANVMDGSIYATADADPEAFWADQARALEWDQPWDDVLSWDPPHAAWFTGGRLNASVNCIDRHLPTRGDQEAFIWEGEDGATRMLTYAELHHEVEQAAGALLALGVRPGDRVMCYMPMVPELPITMLACARIGAVHCVVFAAFSPRALAQRIEDAGSRVLVTIDGFYRRGKVIPQKAKADEALDVADVEHVLVVRRTGEPVDMKDGRDHDWTESLQAASPAPPRPMGAEDPLFIMYTSGTTGSPKGILHTTGGYLTGALASTKWVLDLKPEDIYWCMADIGWITGHTYIVYGPLLLGGTCLLYEGAPDQPARDRPWDIIERHRVTVLYTAPTAIRAFLFWGDEHPAAHDLSTLRLLGTVGEPIGPKAWRWYHQVIGGGRCPIVDTWWQTETGMIMISPLPGVTDCIPGRAMRALPGVSADVLDEQGMPCEAGERGLLAITRPWPSMLRTLWKNDARYVETYWSKWGPEIYFAGDAAVRSEDGSITIIGRVDDIMNVSGHRLGTQEVESVLADDEAVSEAAVVAAPDALRGQVPVAFVIIRPGEDAGSLPARLVSRVEQFIGPIARPARIIITPDLPKTRSGKIMRRLLKDIVEGHPLGDTMTLRNPEVAAQIQALYADEATGQSTNP